MTLRRLLLLTILAQIAGVAILSAVGLVAITSLERALARTTDQFASLRAAHRAGHHLALARRANPADPNAAQSIRAAIVDAALAIRESDPLETPAAASLPEREDLLRILDDAAAETGLQPLLAHAASGLAAVQRLSQRIQRDVRDDREAAIASAEQAGRNILVAGAAIILLTTLLGALQSRAVTKPLAALRNAIDRLRRSDFSEPVARVGFDEHRALADRFNEMADELRDAQQGLERRVADRTDQLIRSERLARLGVLAAGFAHEINNPLAIIRAHAEFALRRLRDPDAPPAGDALLAELADTLEIATQEVDRAADIVARLQRLGAHETPQRTDVRMNDVVEAALRLVEPLASRNAVALERRIDAEPDETTVRADESELLQIVINLLLNALEAAPEGSVRITLDRDADDLRLRVQDDGQGMTRDQRAHAFDPFVSSRARAGLGLAVCQAIAERHHAVIDAHSDGPGQGSVFTLRIPAPVSEAAP